MTFTASSTAGGIYGEAGAIDGDPATWWASTAWELPQRIELTLGATTEVNRIHLLQPDSPVYARWQRVRLTLGSGKVCELELPDVVEHDIVLPTQRLGWLRIEVLSTHQVRHYVGVAEIELSLDPAAGTTPGIVLRDDESLNPARLARVSATSEASAKYSAARLTDGSTRTWWASDADPPLPQGFRLEFAQETPVHSLTLYGIDATSLYAAWRQAEISFSDGSRLEHACAGTDDPEQIEFAERTVTWLEVAVTEVVEPNVYVSCAEVEVNSQPQVFTDPTVRDIRMSRAERYRIDPCEYEPFGGAPASEAHIWDLEANQRLERTIGIEVLEGSPANRTFIALDLPFHPVVMTWSHYARTLWPHMCGLLLDTYRQAAMFSASEQVRARFLELADFAVWSQYDETGHSALLDRLGIEYRPDPEAQGGWPTHDFGWIDGSGYDTPPYEPSHHMDAMTALGLIGAYEVSGEEKYLAAAETFVRRQAEWFGLHPGEHEGKPTLWTEYNPTTGGRPQYDAVDNIIALFAAPTAAVGYHRGDAELLRWTEEFLWWMCKELDLDGRWYYMGTEWWEEGGPIHGQARRDTISHESACIRYSCWAYQYLRSAGIRRPDIEQRLTDAAIFYSARPAARARKLVDVSAIAPGQEVGFTSFILLTNYADRVLVKDYLPTGWERPAQMEVTIRGPGLDETRSVTADELEAGLPLPGGAPGDRYRLSYGLRAPADFAFAEDCFSPELAPYPLLRAPDVVVQGPDVLTGEWYQSGSQSYTVPLRTPARIVAADFERLAPHLYGGQPLTAGER